MAGRMFPINSAFIHAGHKLSKRVKLCAFAALLLNFLAECRVAREYFNRFIFDQSRIGDDGNVEIKRLCCLPPDKAERALPTRPEFFYLSITAPFCF